MAATPLPGARMIDKLEMFVALAAEAHFGRAAARLNIAQPTLSAGIKQLEASLGVQLVHRGGRFGGLTPEGRQTLVWARRILADTRQLRDEMRAHRQGLTGQLRLAAIPTAQTCAARLAGALTRRHPGVRVAILSRNAREILHMLENFEADAGITYLDGVPPARIDTLRLYDEGYLLVCPRDTPLAQQARIDWAALDGQPLALLTPDMQNRRIIDRHLADSGATPLCAIEADSIVALVASVAAGGAMAVLPADLARFLAGGRDLALVPIAPEAPAHQIGLVLPRRDPGPPLLDALMAEARRLPAPA